MIKIKTQNELDLMRAAGKLTADVLDLMREKIRPGISTLELDVTAEDFIRRNNAVPAFKNYRPSRDMTPFPASICASINDEVVHGIPDSNRILQEGDIISIDVGVVLNGYCGDAACTYPVGEINQERRNLLDVTQNALELAINAAVAKNTLGDIGFAVQNYAEKNHCGVVRDYTGHGIGRKMHESPQVPNFGEAHSGMTLKAGMTIAIEPMITSGKYDVKIAPNGWTVLTKDGSDAAHFERTVAIYEDHAEVLTPWH